MKARPALPRLPFPRRLEVKFVLTSVICVTAMVLILGTAFYRYEKAHLEAMGRREMESLCITLGVAFTGVFVMDQAQRVGVSEYLEATIADLMESHGERLLDVRVYDNRRRLLATSRMTDFAAPTYLELPADPLDTETLVVRTGPGLWRALAPIRSGSRTWGYAVVDHRFGLERHILREMAGRLAGFGFAVLAAGIALSIVIARTLAGPIKKLSAAMSSIDGRNLETELHADRDDEIGILQRKFLELLDRLKADALRERELQARLVQAEKLSAVGSLAAGLLHEINNPLTGMSSCLGRLRTLREGDKDARYLDAMERALQHIRGITGELLHFSRPREYRMAEGDLREVAERALHLVEVRLQECRVEIERRLPNEPVPGVWDADGLVQVLVNLFLNACDAMPMGGRLTVAAFAHGDTAALEVTDTGSGIAPEHRRHIFDPFFTTKPKGKGTGLGLAVSLKIVQDHGGTLRAEPARGGTCFRVELPVRVEVPA